jgi:hypothetical protein
MGASEAGDADGVAADGSGVEVTETTCLLSVTWFGRVVGGTGMDGGGGGNSPPVWPSLMTVVEPPVVGLRFAVRLRFFGGSMPPVIKSDAASLVNTTVFV